MEVKKTTTEIPVTSLRDGFPDVWRMTVEGMKAISLGHMRDAESLLMEAIRSGGDFPPALFLCPRDSKVPGKEIEHLMERAWNTTENQKESGRSFCTTRDASCLPPPPWFLEVHH